MSCYICTVEIESAVEFVVSKIELDSGFFQNCNYFTGVGDPGLSSLYQPTASASEQ